MCTISSVIIENNYAKVKKPLWTGQDTTTQYS